VSQFSRETRLKKALDPVREGRYDFVLLDCPPSLGLLTVNALTAAEELIVPIQCEYYALEGLGQLLRNVSLVQQNINPDLRLSGIVMTMFDPRTKLSEQVVEEVQRFFGNLVYDVIIPRTVRLSEAPGFGQPITVYDPRSKGAQTYRQLAAEVALRPPPAEPMPIYDDLPLVLVPAVNNAVIPEPVDEAALEELPIPTVHELLEEAGSEPEVESRSDEEAPVRERVSELPGVQEPSVEVEPKAVAPKAAAPKAVAPKAVAPKAAAPTPPPVVDEDVWEDADEPSPSARPPQSPEPSIPTPPENLPERRVVVIDEDAEFRASPRSPDPSGRAAVKPEPPPAVAAIGATLEEEGHGKRRWRLFRKGGE
jgi:AAA domain